MAESRAEGTQLFGGHRDCLERWSPDDRDPMGVPGWPVLRTLARMSAALDGHLVKATCVTLGCASFVTVVQAADFLECDHAAFVWSLHAAWRGRVFRQGEMGLRS